MFIDNSASMLYRRGEMNEYSNLALLISLWFAANGCVAMFIATAQAQVVFWTFAFTFMALSRMLLRIGYEREISNRNQTNERKYEAD